VHGIEGQVGAIDGDEILSMFFVLSLSLR